MPTILVADDNTNIQKMVSLAFEEQGYDVVGVPNGEAAVRRIPDLRPDLILADVFMPVRNGYEVCEFVKNDPRFAKVPVILLVGAFDPLDESEARRVGADGVLKKPFVPPEPLIAMVTSALERNSRPAPAAKPTPSTVVAPAPVSSKSVIEMPVQRAAPPPPRAPSDSAYSDDLDDTTMFGSGARSLDEMQGGGGANPTPPAAEEEEGEEEGTETASDWRRRTAADFDIPENTAGMSAYGLEEETATETPAAPVPPEAKPETPAGAPASQPKASESAAPNREHAAAKSGPAGPTQPAETMAPASSGQAPPVDSRQGAEVSKSAAGKVPFPPAANRPVAPAPPIGPKPSSEEHESPFMLHTAAHEKDNETVRIPFSGEESDSAAQETAAIATPDWLRKVAEQVVRTERTEVQASTSPSAARPEPPAAKESPAPASAAPPKPEPTPVFKPVTPAPAAPPGPNVDEIVAKVLEKLGPQLQQVFSEGILRPLVENVLKQENQKKS